MTQINPEFIKAKKWNIPEVSHLILTHLLKTKLRTERATKQLKAAAVKAWQSIKKEETQHLVTSMSSLLQAVIASKGFSTKY